MELLLLIPVVAITAFVAVKMTRVRATRPESPSADVTARLEAPERELAETHSDDHAECQIRPDLPDGNLAATVLPAARGIARSKALVVYEGGHILPLAQLIRESLNWLDQYLGPVK